VTKRVRSILPSLSQQQQTFKSLGRFRSLALLSTALTAVTVTSGAFVAGNDAGRAYNDWPYMNGEIVPWEDMIDPTIDGPVYRNIFESTAMVQFDHRMLAYATASAVTATAVAGARLRASLAAANLSSLLTPQVTRGLHVMCGVTVAQVTLGISTLMLYVPVHLAACHQLGSLALLTSGLFLTHSLRYLGTAVRSSSKGGLEAAKKVASAVK
jgi:cytochrome c oxidase assembly protein subunit 15